METPDLLELIEANKKADEDERLRIAIDHRMLIEICDHLRAIRAKLGADNF